MLSFGKVKKRRLYLDTAAGTEPNPASLHATGVEAAARVARARREVALVLGAQPDEIVFTAGGTEANNLALNARRQVVTLATEHASVLAPARRGAHTIVPVDADGRVDLRALEQAITPETELVSVHYVNNEIGTIQPLAQVAKIVRRARKKFGTPTPYLHTDACQAPRVAPLVAVSLGVDLMSLNAAKLYGPRGVGALYVRRGVPLTPLLLGGGQESGRRAGTENVAGIVAFARALATAARRREADNKKLLPLRNYFIEKLLALPGVEPNGSLKERAANNVNMLVRGVLAEQLVLELDAQGVAVSTGAACSIAHFDESYVVRALGRSAEEAASSVRFTLGRDTTRADINFVLKILPPILVRLRQVL